MLRIFLKDDILYIFLTKPSILFFGISTKTSANLKLNPSLLKSIKYLFFIRFFSIKSLFLWIVDNEIPDLREIFEL
jgi:hypothetical protein